jgi:hypothetical protein
LQNGNDLHEELRFLNFTGRHLLTEKESLDAEI